MIRLLVAAVLITALLGSAAAQAIRRNIPADAPAGKIDAATPSQIQIDGKVFRLAPGARILNQRNLTVTPNMVASGQSARYALDASGQVRAVWLVDPDDPINAAPVQRTPATN